MCALTGDLSLGLERLLAKVLSYVNQYQTDDRLHQERCRGSETIGSVSVFKFFFYRYLFLFIRICSIDFLDDIS